MVTPRRSAAVLLALLIFLAWFAWFRPAGLGGPASYIIVSGVSMEPTYHDGDLVVLRSEPGYAAGDVVAYPVETSAGSPATVIHRIVGEDGDGFITQGDNRDNVDPWRATESIVRGAAWLHVPKAGAYLAWLRQPWHLAGLASLIFLVGGLRGAQTHRQRRHRMNRHKRVPGTWSAAGDRFASQQSGLATLCIAASAVAVAFVLLGLFAFNAASHTTSQASEPIYSETGTFDYAIVMEPSTLYPDGILRPQEVAGVVPVGGGDTPASPAPAFTSLTREARVAFRYELQSKDQVELSGTVAADLVIRPRDGEWSRTEPLTGPKAFDGRTASMTVTVDLISVGALIAQIEEETGLSAGTYELSVAARVNAIGTRSGEPLETSFESTFTMSYTRTLITPPSTLTNTGEAASTEMVTTAKSLSLGIWSPSVSTARTLAVVGFAAASGAMLVSGGYLALGLRRDEQARIRARYRSRLVDVQPSDVARDPDAVRVATIHDLARLAERFGSAILNVPLPSGHRYFVRDGEDTYEYMVASSPGTEVAVPLTFTEVDALPFGVTKGNKSPKGPQDRDS